MEKQYTFIKDQIAAGKVVLAYDCRLPKCKVYKIRDMCHVNLFGGDLIINGMNTSGWTFAVKP